MLGALFLGACSSATEETAEADVAPRALDYVIGAERYSSNTPPSTPVETTAEVALGAVDFGGASTVFYSDRAVATMGGDDPEVTQRFDPPVFGVELAPGEAGWAVAAVTLPIGSLPQTSRILWLTTGIEVLLETDRNMSVAGVVDEGIVVRDVESQVVSLVDWSGSEVGLGVRARDAMVIPRTSLLLVVEVGEQRTRVFDLQTGADVPVPGFAGMGAVLQLAASPTDSKLAIAVQSENASELVLFDGVALTVRSLVPLERLDVLAGFSASGDSVALITDGERYGSQVVMVSSADQTVTPVELPAQATPLTWSRTTLTMQPLRGGAG